MTEHSDTFSIEKALQQKGYTFVAGVDEAGRGPLAGPVIAGCVILPPDSDYQRFRDSKKLTLKQRESLFQYILDNQIPYGVGNVSAAQIDQINILQASLLAMKFAVADLAAKYVAIQPEYVLVDGKFTIPFELPQQALVKGESKSASIAAASIVAKVTRDRLMARFHELFPYYNFQKNQGYPTEEHRQAIARYGVCEIHRRTFKGVREYLCPAESGSPRQGHLWDPSQ